MSFSFLLFSQLFDITNHFQGYSIDILVIYQTFSPGNGLSTRCRIETLSDEIYYVNCKINVIIRKNKISINWSKYETIEKAGWDEFFVLFRAL